MWECPVDSRCRAGRGTQGAQGRAAELCKRHVPLKHLCWSRVSPHSMTTANASESLSQPRQRVASSFSPEPGAGHKWVGCTPCGPQTGGEALGVPDARGGRAARHRGPNGYRWPQVQGWAWTATQNHRLSGLGTLSAGAHGPYTSPGSGADGEPRKCLPRRLEATVASRCPCRACPAPPPLHPGRRTRWPAAKPTVPGQTGQGAEEA